MQEGTGMWGGMRVCAGYVEIVCFSGGVEAKADSLCAHNTS